MGRRAPALLLGAGIAVRFVLAALCPSNGDIDHMAVMAGWLVHTPLHVYGREPAGELVWPYLSGYFPVIVLARAIHLGTGLGFAFLVRLPPIAANAAIVWLLDGELRRRRASDRARLAAGLGLLFSPLLVLEAGWHAQLDLVATLCALGALLCWQRLHGDRRPLLSGLLIGLAVLVKIVPGIVVLALIPSARSRRELILLLGSAAATVLAGAGPWLISEGSAVIHVLHYEGLPGVGGLSVLAQPSMAEIWLSREAVTPSGLLNSLQFHSHTLTLIALVAATAYVWWRRPRPELGAVVLLLAALISATDLSLQYFIWLLPFAYLIGESRYLTAFQLLLAIPTLLLYGSVSAAVAPWPRWVAVGVYVPFLDVLWLMCLAGVVLTIRRAGWKHESD